MSKKTLMIILFSALAVTMAGCSQKASPQSTATSSPLILFYSTKCQHCQNVEKYMSDNKITEEITVEQKEISDKANAQVLLEKAQICNLDTNNIGVPFLWTGSTCLIGDEDIINFFKTKVSK